MMSPSELCARMISWTVLVFTAVATVADWSAARASGAVGAAELWRVALSSAAWASLTALVGVAALVGLGSVAQRLVRPAMPPPETGSPKRSVLGLRAAVLASSLPVAVAVMLGGLELLSGAGVSGKSWITAARPAWVIVALLGAVAAGQLLIPVFAAEDPRSRRRRSAVAALLAWMAIAAALVLDRTVYPRLYPVAHLLLWLAVFVAVMVVAAGRAVAGTPGSARIAVLAATALVLGGVAVIASDPLARSVAARAAAYRETLFLKRALTHLKPVTPAAPLAADPDVLAALKGARALDAALLDRALPDRRRMNVVAISIDAVRADRLSSHGYSRPLTKNLDALIAGGADFTNAWTTYPFTLMAFGSTFRGVYASSTDGWRYREAGLKKNPGPAQPTVASTLGDAGFRTEAVVGFPRFVRDTLAREEGFQQFNAGADPRWKDRSLVADEITTLAIDALDREPGRPFFLWVHYFDPHAPYEPPEPHPFGSGEADLYDTEILHTDREIGRFLEAVRARQLQENTAFVVWSDHGEDLEEFDHGTALTEPQIHVPLAVILPRAPARTIATAVDLTDIAPTILELVGLPRPAHFHGQSLLPFCLLDADADAAAFPPDLAFCELGGAGLPLSLQFAARSGAMKIVFHTDSKTDALYDIQADPDESRDLSRASPDVLARMRGVLDAFRSLGARAESVPTGK